LFITHSGITVDLQDSFKNQTCFFIGGGPSLLDEDLSFLQQRGILSFAINNIAAGTVKPTLWACSDNTAIFHANILLDPTIVKFIPLSLLNGIFYIERNDKKIKKEINTTPNVYYYQKRSTFNTKKFLSGVGVRYGCEKREKDDLGIRGGRSTMLAAFKIMYMLGITRVYLLGCDFNMQHDDAGDGKGLTYAFSQYKHNGGVNSNNKCYDILTKRFEALQPIFLDNDFKVFNCTKNSKLEVFPSVSLFDAINYAQRNIISNPNTQGYYGGKENKNRFGID
jgi:hypothetical protein